MPAMSAMKPIKKEDMPKLAALIALSVGVGGYIIFEVITQVVPPAPSAAATPAPNTAASPGVPAPGGAQVALANGATPVPGGAPGATPTGPYGGELDPANWNPVLINGKDPFMPTAPPPVAPTRPAPILINPGNPMSSHPPIRTATNLFVQPPVGPVHVVTPATPPPPPPPAPTYSVVGVVLADRNAVGAKEGQDVAILRSGTDRRFVTVGDPVANGFKVAAIHSGGVDIRSGDRIATLPLISSSSGPAAQGRP